MRRRDFLAATGTSVALALAGCAGSPLTDDPATSTSEGTPTGSSKRSLPDGIYVQRFHETMAMQGTATSGDYAAALMYSVPHKFWNVNGDTVSLTPKRGDVHLMAVVWDPETKTVLPETGLSVEIEKDGELISEEVIYPMLSQRMGFHYGSNFELADDGEYTATLTVGGMSIPRTGSFASEFGESETLEIDFAFTQKQRQKIRARELDKYGQPGAVRPMDMKMVPQALAPQADELPGRALGNEVTDGARLTTVALSGDVAARFGGDGYLAVSPRTRYNELTLPALGLAATVTRGSDTVFDGPLQRKLDSDLGYHYGTPIALQSGDEVRIEPTLPAQVARHAGYERAFLQMKPITYTA